MPQDKPYFEPARAGLPSTPRAACRRVAKLMDALGGDGGVNSAICRGRILDDVQDLKLRIWNELEAAGYRVKVLDNDKHSVLPPKKED